MRSAPPAIKRANWTSGSGHGAGRQIVGGGQNVSTSKKKSRMPTKPKEIRLTPPMQKAEGHSLRGVAVPMPKPLSLRIGKFLSIQDIGAALP
jgi:hypothetical protein